MLEAIQNPACGWFYRADASTFKDIPGTPIAYWASESMLEAFASRQCIREMIALKKGMSTGNNDLFIRTWQEVSMDKVALGVESQNEADVSGAEWFPINSGGGYRKWYGNNCYLVNWQNNGAVMKDYATKLNGGKHWSRYIVNTDSFFKKGITWNGISSDAFSCRWYPTGFLFSSASMCCFTENSLHYLGLLNSSASASALSFLAPTLNFGPLQVGSLPDCETSDKANELVESCLTYSQSDWDSFETSWDFKRHPLV